MKLHDWSIRHDLDGDGLIIKSIHTKGVGYDRPFDVDEVTLDLKVYQIDDSKTERIYQDLRSVDTFMNERVVVGETTKKILQSMKPQERVSAQVRPEFFAERDAAYVERHAVMTDRPLLFEIEMKRLVRVEDVYKDGTTFHKTLTKGEGSASPYADFYVLCKIPYTL